MRNIILYFFCGLLFISCNHTNSDSERNNSNSNSKNNDFEKSYKKQLSDGDITKEKIEYFDEETRLYSNFKYAVAYKETKNWMIDYGSGEYTIFRAYDADSGYTFSINVIEYAEDSKWGETDDIHTLMDSEATINAYKEQNISELTRYNMKPINYTFNKSYLKNFPAMKATYKYIARQGDLEYEVQSLTYQIQRARMMYTFSIQCPYMFYETNPQYFEDIFLYVNFLLID